ncbi:hypothetical protein SAMN04488544_2656 [Microlunatus sagamiharensis]|uniref:Uncharacterized protein n=1 Tax=Microlunatus sagamiharensis TaxID=546874 RepID=A0A1H2MSW3_9ACTN|nr:hypothetical protein [Microlunatus sagamiharensis]SDU96319.1 hypothetical protein SAMN04488544_2656 [Microlunatus sagamiharensis]
MGSRAVVETSIVQTTTTALTSTRVVGQRGRQVRPCTTELLTGPR